jgi:hypothetical protein
MTTPLPHVHHWFLAIFLFCAAIVLSNVGHFILFRLLRRKEAQSARPGWGVQRELGARRARSSSLPACSPFCLRCPTFPSISPRSCARC